MFWGWKHFKGLNSWFSYPNFIPKLNEFLKRVGDVFPGRFRVFKKFNALKPS
jgi:hypothetical protein